MKKNYVTSFLITCLIIFFAGNFRVGAQLPDEFQLVELHSGFTNATSMEFAPDGRIFVLDRFGEIFIHKPELFTTVSAGTIPVYHGAEDGLLAMAFDPNFETNNWVYIYYSLENEDKNRISRFTMNGDLLDLSSEKNMLEWETQRIKSYHAGGDMGFDSQGNLLISTGDNSNHGNYGAIDEGYNPNSAEKSSSNTNDLRGKILRIKPLPNGTYDIPTGNLFAEGTPNTRPEIYVMGARNPYRFFIDKENNDWIFWGEVGPDANDPGENGEGPVGMDEMNLTKEAGNYGWPYFTGKNEPYKVYHATPVYNNPNSPKNVSTWNTGVTDLPPAKGSWMEFRRGNGSKWSIFSGPRYYYDPNLSDQQRLPAAFDGVLFYYNFNNSKVYAVKMDANGTILSTEQLAPSVFPSNAEDGYIDMGIGPDGHMYILEYGVGCCEDGDGSGRLVRVDYTGIVTNSPPIVLAEADVTSGALNLTVNFSSDGTYDPDGDTGLVYEWDFGDGSPKVSGVTQTQHTYTTEGIYNAQLKVIDGDGAQGVKNITIYAGNTKAEFTFNSPPDGGLVGWGDDITIDLEVSDAEDGSTSGGGIDCKDVDIIPSLGHLNHFHDGNTLDGCPGDYTLEYSGHNIDGGDDLYYVLGSNYKDQGNLVSFGQIQLHPKRKEAEFYDQESGVQLIDNTDPLEGGEGAIRVNHNSYIVLEGRNLANISSVKYYVASNNDGGSIELRLDSANGTLLATSNVPNTGGASNWEYVETNFVEPGGKHDLYFVFKNPTSQQNSFDINFIEFVGAGVSVDMSPPLVNSVRVNTPTEVRVVFSEYVTASTAEQLSNYTINNGVTISSAELLSDNRTVILSTSSLDSGITYEINIKNVKNTSGISIVAEDHSLSTINAIRINVGGDQTVLDDQIFLADTYASGGNQFDAAIPINGTTDDTLYQTERYGTFSYEIPVPASGEYDIRLHFAELYFGVGSRPGGQGSRVFNISIENKPVLTNFDILSEVEAATALRKEIDNISVTDGFVSISFTAIEENPKLSGIEVLPPDTFVGEESRPKITITSPMNGWEVNEPFQVAFAVENWVINEGDTHVHYFVNGTLVDKYYGYDPIPIDGYGAGQHTIKVELFNADHTGTGIYDEVVVNVTGQITCNETPFPESWSVKQLEESSLPYPSVYTFAKYDFDGDGLKDIVTGSWWYKNPGSVSGDWIRNDIGENFGNVVHVYDFDGDGNYDLLGTALGIAPDSQYESEVLLWAKGDGAGNFTIYNNIPAGNTGYWEPFVAGLAGGVFSVNGPYQMAINWNGAEKTDAPIQMLTPSANPTEGTWSLVDISEEGESSGEDIQAGDIDRDGDLDLFQGVNWLRNDGSGNFEIFDTGISYVSTPDRAQLADFDRDGDLDAVVGQLSADTSDPARDEFAWFEAPSDPTQPWIRHLLDTDIKGSLSVFASDIDFDGDQDIIVGEWRGSHRLIAFENDLCGSGEFNLKVLDAGGPLEHHDGARVVDIDNDGDLDIISNGWRNDNRPRIYENTTIRPEDDRPIANAGDDRTVLPGVSLKLNGQGSDPDGGDIVAFQWTQVSGPNDTGMSNTDTQNVTINGLVEGIYVFRLSVTDDEGDTAFDDVTITVSDSQTSVSRVNAGGPNFTFDGNSWSADQYYNGGGTITNIIDIANTENDQLYQTERYRATGSLIYEIPVNNGELSVNLHFAEIYYGVAGGAAGGAGSRIFNIDVEGQQQKENYDIFVAAGGAATAVIETFSGINVTDGSLTITLTPVTEYPKISGIEIIEPVVEGAPTADAGDDQVLTLPISNVVLTGFGSDPDGGEVSYAWSQKSGPDLATLSGADTASLTVSNLSSGVYVFTLVVTDDEGESDSDTVTVTVVNENGLLAVAEAAPTEGSAPLEVTFTGSKSFGDVVSYLWDFQDGKTSTDSDTANTFVENGTYNVELTVTDAEGVTDTATVTIIVSETLEGDKMGYILKDNPVTEGVVSVRVLNQPADFMMLGVNLHDQQGRLISDISAEDIVLSGDNAYNIPVYLLRDGIYFLNIVNNMGDPVTIKFLVKN
ncbi:malectin domain-containing carbohydrate-binding protein [Zobellia galactanivorans]|uniref:malectin domain-containing carbohydrate-binding protein n=1 Tax=Zobellia galactanivorans (strain DSM 12802 / CCUG 47099 / CIP 106680 / NCIMB 13871 / Dsij) TaxID=63186 RepID=UPI001C07E19F|nr:malectin domain-containing carbohydrate-binding protein [Zobellia galactanivorans]MBU3024430.1 PQQ-dependent sugar dehydrogenase [Zobellia galactanivorans]